MEKSLARESLRRDLSAPWLRHSGRDDGWVAHSVISTVGSAGTGMEKSLARKRFGRDLSAPWLRHSGRDDGWVC
jgi:hypothetical protein